jgi:transposase
MGNPRARYTQEFMVEAVRMVRGGQSMAAVAKILGISPKTLHNWVKADAAGKLSGAGKQVSTEQMEIARLRAELARVKMERDILEKATARSTGRTRYRKQCHSGSRSERSRRSGTDKAAQTFSGPRVFRKPVTLSDRD